MGWKRFQRRQDRYHTLLWATRNRGRNKSVIQSGSGRQDNPEFLRTCWSIQWQVLTKVERAMADSSSRQGISRRSEGAVRCYEVPCGVGVYIWTGLFSI